MRKTADKQAMVDTDFYSNWVSIMGFWAKYYELTHNLEESLWLYCCKTGPLLNKAKTMDTSNIGKSHHR